MSDIAVRIGRHYNSDSRDESLHLYSVGEIRETVAEIERLRAERNTWQSRYSNLLDEFKELRDYEMPKLKARLAEAERLLREVRDEDVGQYVMGATWHDEAATLLGKDAT